jgi:hypothetical protein
VLQVLEGLLVGVIDAEVPDLETCVNDVLEDIGYDIVEAVTELNDNEARQVEASIRAIGQGVASLADVVQECGLAAHEIEQLQTIGANFANPATFAYHVGKDLLVNGVSIYNDVELAIQDYQDELWFDMGVQVGTAIALAVLGSDLPVLTLTTE